MQSANIKFLQAIPDNGSEISTFDIKLKFDISEAIAETGNSDIAIGYSGNTRDFNTKLYDGTAESGTLLTTTLTTSVKPLENSQDCIDLEIPSSFVPEPGHTYTIVFANQIAMYAGPRKTVPNSVIDYSKEPLILTFYGKSPEADEFLFQNASIRNNDNLELINSINFEFNEDIKIVQNKPVQIYKGEELITSSKSIAIDPQNEKSLIVTFDEVTLYLGNEYSIKLPEGVVCLKNDAAVLNKPVEIKVNGASTIRLSTKYISPENSATVLPLQAEIKFNLLEGQTLTPPGALRYERGIDFYKGEISDENFISTLLGTASGDGITWDLSKFQFEPETKYILRKKADDITVWVNGKSQPAYGNEEVIINFTTPSVEEAGFIPMEFITPHIKTEVLSNYVYYAQDMAIPSLHTFRTELKGRKYIIGTQVYDITKHPNAQECGLYVVGTDGDKLVKSFNLYVYQAEDNSGFWNRANVNLITPLYEGQKYKLVIPEGYFTGYPEINDAGQTMDLSKCNYIKSKEMVYTFTGTTPAKSVLLGCNIADNAEVSSIYNIIWTFEGDYKLGNSANTVKREYTSANGAATQPQEHPVTVSTSSGKTYVMVDFVSKITGKPLNIYNGTTSTFTVPKGLIVNTVNDEIVNDEIVLTVKGVAEEGEPETVWVNMTINGMHTAVHPAVKGKSYTFSLNPGTDWKITSVKNGSTSLVGTASDPNYPEMKTFVLPSLKDNTNVDATLEYNGTWAKEDSTTEVWTIEENNIRIYCDNNMIVVDGVTPENTINVYNVAGMFINSTRVSDGHDRVYISVPVNQTYIVSVDGVAAKIYVK